jgi:hypothetical protein
MAAPSALTLFNTFKANLGNGTFDMDGNSFKAALFTSSASLSAGTGEVFGDLTNEVANGNGYTSGGVSLTSPTFTQTSGTAAFKTGNNPSWTGSGSGFSARYMVIYASGTLNGKASPLVGFLLLDSTPADVSFAAGNTVTVTQNSAGWFTLT